ncbi:hypothetical protein SNEBB_008483 [Seison nebaliae]|nr:hypothetical protein SNEBB_008483 [Seison nebaliae]
MLKSEYQYILHCHNLAGYYMNSILIVLLIILNILSIFIIRKAKVTHIITFKYGIGICVVDSIFLIPYYNNVIVANFKFNQRQLKWFCIVIGVLKTLGPLFSFMMNISMCIFRTIKLLRTPNFFLRTYAKLFMKRFEVYVLTELIICSFFVVPFNLKLEPVRSAKLVWCVSVEDQINSTVIYVLFPMLSLVACCTLIVFNMKKNNLNVNPIPITDNQNNETNVRFSTIIVIAHGVVSIIFAIPYMILMTCSTILKESSELYCGIIITSTIYLLNFGKSFFILLSSKRFRTVFLKLVMFQ